MTHRYDIKDDELGNLTKLQSQVYSLKIAKMAITS